MKNLLKKSKEKFYLVAAGATSYFMMSPAFASADNISSAVNKASNGISNTAKASLPAVVTIVLILLGILLFVGGERGKETAKQKAGLLFIGAALVLFGSTFATTIISWFK